MELKIKYDNDLLTKQVIDKITLTTNTIQDIVVDSLIEELSSDANVMINIIVINDTSNNISVKRSIEKQLIVIEKQIHKDLYIENTEKQVISDMLEIIKILCLLGLNSAIENYILSEEKILDHFDYSIEDIKFNQEILEICQLITKAQKICANEFSARYEFEDYFKSSLFIKYKTNMLFIFLYENLICHFALTYKSAIVNLRAFNIYKNYDNNKEDKYYKLHKYLIYYCQSEIVVRNKWFYFKKSILLIPLYIAIQTGKLIYPTLAIAIILGILYMDYLIGINKRKNLVICESIKFFLYIILPAIAMLDYFMNTSFTK